MQTTAIQQSVDSMSTPTTSVAVTKSNSSSASSVSFAHAAFGDHSAFAALNAITCGGVQTAMELVKEQLAQGLPTPDAEQTMAILDRTARNVIENSQLASAPKNNSVIVMVTCPTNDTPSAVNGEKNVRQIVHPIQEEASDDGSYIEESSLSSTEFQDTSSISTFGSAASILANDAHNCSTPSLPANNDGATKKTSFARPGLKRSSGNNDAPENPHHDRDVPASSTGDRNVSGSPFKGQIASFLRRNIPFHSKRAAPLSPSAEIKLAAPSPAIFVSPFIDSTNFLSVPTMSLMTGRRDDDDERDYMVTILDMVYDADEEDWADADDEEDSVILDFSSLFFEDELPSMAQEPISPPSPAFIHDFQSLCGDGISHEFEDNVNTSMPATHVADMAKSMMDQAIAESDTDLVTAAEAIRMSPEIINSHFGCEARGGDVVTIDEWWDAATNPSEGCRLSTRSMAIRLTSTESIPGPRATRRTAAMRRRVSERIGEAFIESPFSGRRLSPIVEGDGGLSGRARFRSIIFGKEQTGLRQGFRKFRQLF